MLCMCVYMCGQVELKARRLLGRFNALDSSEASTLGHKERTAAKNALLKVSPL